MTRQRRIILEELTRMQTHPTADEIYQQVRHRLPNISLGTVYRNLEVLTQCGVINKIETTGSHMRFDHVVENHYHIRCIRCNNLNNVMCDMDSAVEDIVKSESNYTIIGHRLEILGICPGCQNIEHPADGSEFASLKD
jgi:Fur family ferric uptake transcriptional regulator